MKVGDTVSYEDEEYTILYIYDSGYCEITETGREGYKQVKLVKQEELRIEAPVQAD